MPICAPWLDPSIKAAAGTESTDNVLSSFRFFIHSFGRWAVKAHIMPAEGAATIPQIGESTLVLTKMWYGRCQAWPLKNPRPKWKRILLSFLFRFRNRFDRPP